MKVVVTVRTRDEEHRIGQFCEAYQGIADTILVADGGSEDRTLEIAATFPNVQIRHYTKRTKMWGDYWRNNDSDHINFLTHWATELEPDWIIHDDCDCRPNYLLKEKCLSILEETEANAVMAVRLFVWGKDQHFPLMARPAGDWEASLYAWRPEIELFTVDRPPAYTLRLGDEKVRDLHLSTSVQDLRPPLCLLHYSWDDPERVREKVKVYRESGLIPGQLHPTEFAGEPAPLPEWAHE
jgi:hypothetical protein